MYIKYVYVFSQERVYKVYEVQDYVTIGFDEWKTTRLVVEGKEDRQLGISTRERNNIEVRH